MRNTATNTQIKLACVQINKPLNFSAETILLLGTLNLRLKNERVEATKPVH